MIGHESTQITEDVYAHARRQMSSMFLSKDVIIMSNNQHDSAVQTSMSPAELAALASQCYGQRWQSALAREMNVNVRTVQRWAAFGIDRQATADSVRRFLTDRRVINIHGADSSLTEVERDAACYDAMESPLKVVATAADSQGWYPAEVWTAILAIAADKIYAMVGRDAAIESIGTLVEQVRERPEHS